MLCIGKYPLFFFWGGWGGAEVMLSEVRFYLENMLRWLVYERDRGLRDLTCRYRYRIAELSLAQCPVLVLMCDWETVGQLIPNF